MNIKLKLRIVFNVEKKSLRNKNMFSQLMVKLLCPSPKDISLSLSSRARARKAKDNEERKERKEERNGIFSLIFVSFCFCVVDGVFKKSIQRADNVCIVLLLNELFGANCASIYYMFSVQAQKITYTQTHANKHNLFTVFLLITVIYFRKICTIKCQTKAIQSDPITKLRRTPFVENEMMLKSHFTACIFLCKRV